MTNRTHTPIDRFLAFVMTVFLTTASVSCFADALSDVKSAPLAPVEIRNPAKAVMVSFPKTTPTGEAIPRSDIITAIEKQLAWITRASQIAYDKDTSTFSAAWYWSLAFNYNALLLNFPAHIEEGATDYSIMLDCPSTMMTAIRDHSITGIPQWDMEDISKKSNRACTDIDINLYRYPVTQGETTSKRGLEQVIASFRKNLEPLSQYDWDVYSMRAHIPETGIESGQPFLVRIKDRAFPVRLFFTQEGERTKITYEIHYFYRISKNSGTNYNPHAVSEIQKVIYSIANR